MEWHSSLGEDAHRLVADERHRAASVGEVVRDQAAEDMHSLDGQGLDSGEEEDKHYAALAILEGEDMGDRSSGPDIGLVWPGLVEDMGCGRLFLREDETTVEGNSHLGSGRPAEGTEAVVVPWSRPSAPCVVQRSWGG